MEPNYRGSSLNKEVGNIFKLELYYQKSQNRVLHVSAAAGYHELRGGEKKCKIVSVQVCASAWPAVLIGWEIGTVQQLDRQFSTY